MFKNKEKLDKKSNWLDFGLNYFELAKLGCKEMQTDESDLKISDLYIATVYNVKHGIEVLLKSVIVNLENKNLIKKDEIHNQKMLYKKVLGIAKFSDIKNVIKKISKNIEKDDYWVFIDKKTATIEQHFDLMGDLIYKYQHLSFLKDKIKENFIIEDSDNTAFRYPQNSLKIKIDYKKVLGRVNDSDITKLNIDINKLISMFISLHLIISHYTQIKK